MRYRFPLSFFMKITGIAWMSLLCLGSPAQAQEEGVDTLFWNGPAGERINVVVLPDGYVASEREVFVEDARRIVRALMETTPFLEYDTFFNGVAVFVPSEETGANHPGTATDVSEPVFPVAVVNNRFGSRFDVGNIHRLLVPSKGGAILTALAEHFPQYDQVIILVNTPYYGGSGGAFATTSLHPSAPQIAIHEIGHSFAQLADEYYAGDQYARETHNMTANTDPATVRWKNWYGDEGIGIYQHCCGGRSAEFYRPHENCMMRSLGRPFCAVCRERIVARIYELVNPLTLTPEPGREFLLYENDTLDFSAAYLANGQGDNLMRWWLDAVHLGDSTGARIEAATLGGERHRLRAEMWDPTVFSRQYRPDSAYRFGGEWDLVDCTDLLSPEGVAGPDRGVVGEIHSYRVSQGMSGGEYEWAAFGGEILEGQGTDSVKIRWLSSPAEVCVRPVKKGTECRGEDYCLVVDLDLSADRSYQPPGWDLRLSPIPVGASEMMQLSGLSANAGLWWRVIDQAGRTLREGSIASAETAKTCEVGPAPGLAGQYFLHLQTATGQAWLPFIVQ